MSTPCPACHADCRDPATVRYSAAEAAQHFVLAEEYPAQHARLRSKIAALWQAEHCEMLRCAACGLVFAHPFVAGDGEFYNLAYPHSSYPSQRWEFLQTLQALERTASLPAGDGRVLEIGSGFGYFLRQLAPRFVARDRVVAIEYNNTARQRLLADGFDAIGEDVRAPSFERYRGQVNAIFMFQVLEHMDRLEALFTRLAELAQPRASLFVAVPNHRRIAFNEGHSSMRDMPPNHISQWTEAAFAALAARHGMTVEAFCVQPMSLPAFVKMDLVYSHMQRAQRSGSLANRIRSRPRTRARVALEGLAAVAGAPLRLPAWADAARSGALGDSAWLHLRFPGTTLQR